MNAPLPIPVADPFAEVEHGAAQHFQLAIFGVIARVIEECAGDVAAALEAHPFLDDYHGTFAAYLPAGAPLASSWREALAQWEARSPLRLPLCSLIEAGLGRLELELLLAAGLVEEDPRFGDLFVEAQGRERRPTLGLLLAWWRGEDGDDRAPAVRRALIELVRSGLLEVLNPDASRPDWILAVPHVLWDCLRGDPPAATWLKHAPLESLPALDDYIAPGGARAQCASLPGLLRAQPDQLLVVRGPAHNGRRTLLGGIARSFGKSTLTADGSMFESEARLRLLGTLCALLDALPIVHCDLAPGETRVVPPLPFSGMPLALATTNHGAWSSADARPQLTLELAMPGVEERALHWQAALPGHAHAETAQLAAAARLTSGNVRRAAAAAAGFAALAGRATIEPADLQQACRGLGSARLETLATRLPARGALRELVVDDVTREEIDTLAVRCRVRERLAAADPGSAQGSAGVRALFAGGSGTGKTLAARLLAATLGKDLYRIDLAATVSRYLGDTEKSLNQAFAAAEELDIVLLLDEGDALMANRTDVSSSNDRYANLETNFLLQRIESFDGILLVTSNAADRIDKAFARRMDVVIHFRAPDEWRRYDIIRQHLGGEADVDERWLQDAASRCALTGGQWRNVVSHARLLALQEDRAIGAGHLHAALVREYRKTGAQCPLRPARPAGREA